MTSPRRASAEHSILSRRRVLQAGAAGAATTLLFGVVRQRKVRSEEMTTPSARAAWIAPGPVQTMAGFGAAGAWWPNDLIDFDPGVQEQVADLLFSPRGIALSVYRFNIGGGGVGVSNPTRAPETFLVEPGRYNWERNPGGRRFLQLAAGHGVPVLTGFVNSAPAVWTTTGANCGGLLRPGAEEAYAGYLADVVTHFHDAEGITLSYLSPMNEPAYRFEGCGQEGMAVPVRQRPTVLRALGRELASRATYCKLIADESSQVGRHFNVEVPQWLAEPGIAEQVAALAHHGYDFADAPTLLRARQIAEQYGRPLWTTELCCFDSRSGSWGQQYDPTISGAITLANLMWQGMTYANDAAFHWWVALSAEIGSDPVADPASVQQVNEDGWNDGLLYYDARFRGNGNQQIYVTKRFYGFGNFSRYVRLGDQRYEVFGGPLSLRILAFSGSPDGSVDGAMGAAGGREDVLPSQRATGSTATPEAQRADEPAERFVPDRRWSIVIINNAPGGAAATSVDVHLPSDDRTRYVAVDAVETSSERNLDPVALPEVRDGGVLIASLPAQSITTFVLRSERAV